MHQNARQDALKIPGLPLNGGIRSYLDQNACPPDQVQTKKPDHPLPPITAYHLTALFIQAES